MSAALEVWFVETLAGMLTSGGGTLRFRYEPAWLKSRGFTPLSPALPRSARAYSGLAVESFFENLLPSPRMRDAIGRIRGVSKRDIFGMLAVLGGELRDRQVVRARYASHDPGLKRADVLLLEDERHSLLGVRWGIAEDRGAGDIGRVDA